MKNQSAPSFIPPTMLVQNFARPAGVSLLDAMVHQYEKDTGRKSQLPAATIAKIEGPASATASLAERFTKFLTTGSLDRELSQADARRLLDMSRAALLARPSAAATPAPSPTSETVSAREFEGPPLKMTKPEFDKLTPAGKSKFCISGGKLV